MYLLYAIFAALPSLIWLGFYLRHDARPEPKKIVLGLFAAGMIAAVIAIFFEKGAAWLYRMFQEVNQPLLYIIYIFIGIGFVEEFLKYIFARIFFLRHRECDEPFDIVLYLIIAALGFTAVENFLKFLRPEILPSFQETIMMSFILALTSTVLHVIASGILGCFVAYAYYKHNWKILMVSAGIAFVTLLHGFYDFSIMRAEGAFKYALMFGLLILMTAFLWIFIPKIKKLPSICN